METSNSLDSNRRSSHDCLDDDADGSREDAGRAERGGFCWELPPCFPELPSSSSSSSSSLMKLVSGLMCHCGPAHSVKSVCCCCLLSTCCCSGTSLFCSLTLSRTSWQAFRATSGSITGSRKQRSQTDRNLKLLKNKSPASVPQKLQCSWHQQC